jgi:thioester reductase-like protein
MPIASRSEGGQQLRQEASGAAGPGGARARAAPSGGWEAADGVLLSGATGFLGMALLARYLERTDRRIYALVRARDDRHATSRIEQTLKCLFGPGHPHGQRVTAVRGDLCRPGLGLASRTRLELSEQVSEVVHGAADVSFEIGLREARSVNVQGTQRMLELAEGCMSRGGLRRFTYISTAYVAGDHSGCFSEDDLDVGQRFHNAYENSKFEAELLVARWRGRLPITVTRPSIVVGERGTGWTSSFNVLYWPLRAFARGTYLALPARGSAPVDVVPVDYVTDAILALAQTTEAQDGIFHLTAGRHVCSVGELVELASSFFGRPAPRMIDPALYHRVVHPLLLRSSRSPRFRRTLQRSEVFFPYFAATASYDDRRTRAVLHGRGIEASPLEEYFERLVRFALAADWGRRALPRTARALPPASAPRPGAQRPIDKPAVFAR